MPGKTQRKDENTISAYLSSAIPKIFDQVQVSVANHQKNYVALYKIHSDVAEFVETVNNGRLVKLTGERLFEEIVNGLFLNVLPVKKGVPAVDRVIKFIGGYTKFINEKAAEDKATRETIDLDEDEDTTATRFTARLLRFLLKGVEAKDKNVRYRVLHTLVEMVSHLGEIDEAIYNALRDALLGRVKDKEAVVRSQAVIALSKLCAAEADEDIDNDQVSVMMVLLDSLAHDPAADVRRAALLNLPINNNTLPHILDRMRDTETTIRKVVLSAVLEPNTTQGDELKVMGPAHPRAISIAQREVIVKNGLGDREDSVRAAASSLIGTWIDVVNIGVKTEVEEGGTSKPHDAPGERVLSLLNLFDLGQDTVAADALLSVFTTRPDIFDAIQFDENYWNDLTPERAFLARVFVDHSVSVKDEARLEMALPVVTALAFYIQNAFNTLLQALQDFVDDKLVRVLDDSELQEREEDLYNKELILAEMLRLAVNLDYGDEIGRRKMFQLVRTLYLSSSGDMCSREILPESLVGCCMDVLRKLAIDEKDLIRVVVEIVADLRDPFTDEPEEPISTAEASQDATPATPKPPRQPKERSEAEQKQALEIDARCLSLSTAMLERVNTTFEENSTLEGLMRDLIIPSVHIKDAHIREKAFICLGLCCSIARRRALSSVDFFKSQILSSPDKMKPSLYKILFDMLMVHELAFARSQPKKVQEITDEFLISRLREERDPKVLATICLGISKLVLAGIARDINSVANLMLAFLSPATAGNQELRQCLTCFFPVYSYSSIANQRNILGIFLRVFAEVKKSRTELDEDEEMATMPQVANMFVDLTDPTRLSTAVTANGLLNENQLKENEELHLKLAIDILKELLKPQYEFDKEDKKVLCQVFSKLYIPDVVDDELIRRLKLYIDTLQTRRPLRDTTSRNALAKFDALISKKFEKQLEFEEAELRKLEELQDLFDFLDDIIPEDDSEIIELDNKRKGKKRSMSVATTEDETLSHESNRSKPKGKRRRVSGEDDDSDDQVPGTPPPAVKTRIMPKRAATGKIPTQPIVLTDSDDDEDETPRNTRYRSSRASKVKTKEEEEDLDRDISKLLDPISLHAPSSPLSSLGNDSELGYESEGAEEAEVSGLLVE